MNFATLDPSTFKFADRVVEVHCGHWTQDTPADLALFTNQTRLSVFGVSRSLSLQQKFRRLKVNCSAYGKNPSPSFHPSAQSRPSLSTAIRGCFPLNGEAPLPHRFRIFCDTTAEGVT